MNAKAKAIITTAFLLTVVIILGACAPEEQLPVLREAQNFTLTNQDGLEVKLFDFRSKVVVMNFIYTSCPDVCGMLSHKMSNVRNQLEQRLKRDLILISVSFDPAVDTPEVLKQYAGEQGFNVPGWHFLTGTEEQVRRVTDDYGVVYELVKDDHEHADEGTQEHAHLRGFNHNIVVVLIDRDGMVRKTYEYAFFPETEMLSAITLLLEQ